MLPVLREQLKVINPWLEDDQVEEVVKQLTASFPSTGLIQNNRHVFQLLLENTSVSENRKTGEKSPTVRFVDFKHRDNNRFIAVCQFKVRILGTEHHIYPGHRAVPERPAGGRDRVQVAQGEGADPRGHRPASALQRAARRQGRGQRAALLLQPVRHRDLPAGGASSARSPPTPKSTSTAGPIRIPRTLNDLEHGSSSPNDQQRLVAGMLDRDNLLDIIRTFTLFSTNDKGETIKIVGRYQQFRAVKLAVKRLLEGKTPRERSGIIWHTQGSGKSLTMMFMVREMYRHPSLSQVEGGLRHRPHAARGPARPRPARASASP